MKEKEIFIEPKEVIPTEGLTQEEDKELVNLLLKWKGGRISTPVYTELARILPQPVVEIVVFRKNNDILETLLIPRPQNDVVWPGMFHTPGTVLRRSDYFREDENPINGVFERIQHGEINNDFVFTPTYVGHLNRMCDRGPEAVEVYFAELPEGSDKSNYVWYPVDKLAENPKFIQHQLGHVNLAVEQYEKIISE